MDKFFLKNFETERNLRLRALAEQGKGAISGFEECLKQHALPGLREEIRNAFIFAENLNYHHHGLSKEAYFAHPLRVACLALRLMEPANSETVIVALLHNVLEVTDVSAANLEKRFGGDISDAISALTIERNKSGEEYLEAYYTGIIGCSRPAIMVKILDKLDNLFMLCLNPDDEPRKSYLNEIEAWIIPMTESSLPRLADYMKDLVANCWDVGYTGNPFTEKEPE